MSKRLLYLIIIVLVITNIISFIVFKGDNQDSLNDLNVNDDGNDPLVEKKDDHVALIGDREITYQEWMKSLRETHGKSHLKELIDREVVEKLVEQKDFFISDKVIEREIAFLTTMSGIMDKEEIIEQENKWEKDLRYRYQLEALLTEGIHIPDEEVSVHYQHNRNQYDFSASFQLSHILVPDMDTAEKVISELEQGASFNLLAKEYSLDEDTKDVGGYLGYFTKGNQFIPYGYEEIITDMEDHSYSKPISLGNAVAIIYLHRHLPEVKFTFDELKEHVERELAYKRIDQHNALNDLWDELEVEWVYEE